MHRFHKAHKVGAPRLDLRNRARLTVEVLESRLVPYALTGNAWPHPQLVTISFVPDGTIVGSNGSSPIYSNLFAQFNARWGSPAVWENQIIAAAQLFAQQTNLNFEVVPDNGTPIGQGNYQQGDPGMGDIRISGYTFVNNWLAGTYLAPAGNNYSIAGDMAFNTAAGWNIGFAYDLYSVAVHEFGHALGLGENYADPTSVMWPYYNGLVAGLGVEDNSDIRTLYSGGAGRTPDFFDTHAPNNFWYTAADLTGYINPVSKTVLLPNMNIISANDVDWYVVQVPAGSVSTPMILVQTYLQSMLRPSVTVISNGVVVASGSVGSPIGGSLLVVNPTNVVPGQILYIEVAGENATAFGTGKYALSINFGTGATPSVGPVATATVNSNPLQSSAGQQPQLPPLPAAASINAPSLGAVLRSVQVGATQGNAVALQPTVFVNTLSVLSPAATAAVAVPYVPGSNGTISQPAPVFVPNSMTIPIADEEPGQPSNPVAPPATEAVADQPEPGTRAVCPTAGTWVQGSTAYFSSDPGSEDQNAGAMSDTPTGYSFEAVAAVAGFLAVTGEQRLPSARASDAERRQRPGR
jgi:hypothetical protein